MRSRAQSSQKEVKLQEDKVLPSSPGLPLSLPAIHLPFLKLLPCCFSNYLMGTTPGATFSFDSFDVKLWPSEQHFVSGINHSYNAL